MLPTSPKRDDDGESRRRGVIDKLWGIGGGPRSARGRGPLARYAGMGFELGASIIGLTLLGLWIDHHFGTSPVWVLVGAGLGVTGGFYNFIRAALRISKLPASRTDQPDTDEDHGSHERR